MITLVVAMAANTEAAIAGSITWSVENEIHLFDSLIGFKPVGVNKHFHMLPLMAKFSELTQSEVDSADIWHKLAQLYDLNILDEMEQLPFSNKVVDFSLPDSDFFALIKQRQEGPVGGANHVTSSEATPTDNDTQRSLSSASSNPVEVVSSSRGSRRGSDVSDVSVPAASGNRRASRRASTTQAGGPVTAAVRAVSASPAASGTPPPSKRARRH